jgi:hypothetical protein
MAKQTINIGSVPNDGTGDPIRDSFDKCNDNFNELYALATKETITVTSNGQTIVTFTTAVSANALVFVNGNYNEDYSITNTMEITFDYGLNEYDKVTKR